MHLLLRILLLFLMIVTAETAYAANIRPALSYEHLGEEQGLTTKTVYSIIQDRDGFMWFATDAGAFRYDGKNFRHYTVDDGLTDNEILKIYQDRKDRIWFLTLNGHLSYLYQDKIYNSINTPFLREAYLGFGATNIYEDRKGRLWIGCKMAGFIIIDDSSVQKIMTPFQERLWAAHYTYEDSKGVVWIFYRNYMINPVTHDSIPLPSNIVYAHTQNPYIILYEGTYEFKDGRIGQKINIPELPSLFKICNFLNFGSDMWVCTLGEGCLLFRNNKLVKRYLENSSVTSITIDREGNKWFSTINEGVFFLTKNNENIIHYSQKSGLSAEKIISMAMDKNKSIWIGYNNGMVDKIDGSNKITLDLHGKDDMEFIRITNLSLADDTLWCGTDVAVYYIVNNIPHRVPFFNDPTNTNPYAVKNLIRKDKTWYASYSLNFLKIQKSSNQFKVYPLLDSLVRIFSSVSYGDQVLVSSSAGLKLYSPGRFENFTTDSTIAYVRAIDMKSNGNELFISSNNNGLFILKDRQVSQHINVRFGLSDNNCRKIFIDKDRVYVCTANGLSILNKAGDKWRVEKIINARNGLLSNGVNDVMVSDNKIYIGTDNGLSIIENNARQIAPYYNKIYVTELVTNDTIPAFKPSYDFSSDIGRILIRFSYPVYDPLNKIPVKYRLNGKLGQEEWNVTNNNEVEFSSLAPGSYIFEIKPDLNDAATFITTLHINIIPKWWQTIWAKTIAILLISGLVVYYFRRRVKKQYERTFLELKHESMIEAERNRIASDMHDDIGGDLTQISMWLNILHAQEKKDGTVMQKVRGLSNEVLAKMDQIIWALNSLNNHSTDLISYIRAYASECLESSGIKLIYSVDENFPDLNIGAIQRRNIFLAIKELLNNTIKHSQAVEVRLHFSIRDNQMIVEYSDNGKGFDMKEINDGLGLLTLKNRMAEINSQLSLQSELNKGVSCQLKITLNHIKN